MNGFKSDYFDIYQGVAQGCTLSPTLFLIFIDGLMKEIERTVPSLPSLELNGLLFADVFVGLSDSEQALIDVVYAYRKKWRFEANVAKCAVVFRNEKELDGSWTWGGSVLPHLNYYTCSGVKFTCNGHWDAHLKDLVTSGKCKLNNSLLRILCNPSHFPDGVQLRDFLSRCSKNLHKYIFVILISTGFGGLVVRVLVLHLCDSGSNPTVADFFFACHEFVTLVRKRVKVFILDGK